ncbi:TonB-dependent receptor [Pseudoflavitalea sp. G-6-1-2]|uniref:outer membrane beta-barrel family protein n=1 Tax=Pseudoflavitalea sp. G-6-1-2 TaxID=2728841 RepID=UPI00146E34E4|nr:outer membrane beta-barrel family protein [Pseudoflavitalea sp. G-6-1-2]NML19316.1 TonB-dependent receptor [Pseudoflavitalea sp. G-6-1-2]
MKSLTIGLALMIATQSLTAQTDTTIKKDKDLAAVTVTAAKNFVTMKNGTLVLDVASSPAAAGGTAWEIIKRGPGISDQNNKLQFRGKNVIVLLDGRPTNLSGDDLFNLLSSMPANTVATVELISNPSAKYDAQGGAVVNIITTKSKKLGTNGTLTAGTSAGRYGMYNGGASLNYRNNHLNAYGSYDYRFLKTYTESSFEREMGKGQLLENTDRLSERVNQFFKGGIEWNINPRHTIGLMAKGGINTVDGGSFGRSLLADTSSTTERKDRSRVSTPSVNLYYKWLLNSKGTTLTMNADHMQYNKKWKDDFVTRYYDAAGSESHAPYVLRDNSPANNQIQSVSLDFTHKTKFASYEAGLKATLTRTDNDVLWETSSKSGWQTDFDRTNHFIYHENIYAAYVSANKEIGKFSVQTGLRAEETRTKGNLVTWNMKNERNYFNLFPSLNIDYTANDKNTFSFNYRRSITRFKFDVVNPFIVFRSQYSYYQGNPDIRPSTSNSFEITHSFRNKLITSAGYIHYNDILGSTFKEGKIPGSVINSSENLGTGDLVSLTIMHTASILRNKWNMTNTVNGFYAKQHTPDKAQNQGMLTAMATSQHTILLPKGFKAELSGSFSSPMRIGVIRVRSVFSMSGGVSKSVFDNRGSVSFYVADILNSYVSRYNVNGSGIDSYSRTKEESRFVRLSFTWKFGNNNVKVNTNRRNGVETESRRMGE